MSFLFPNYKRESIEMISGSGNYLTDRSGKKYLDFTSGIGVMNLGYNHPKLNNALMEQASLLWHTPNLYENHLQEEVAEKLANGKDYVAYFCNSGAEANEAAIKLARKATGKTKVITFLNSFHGRTYGAMSATGQTSIHAGFQPLVPDFTYLPFNDLAQFKQAVDSNTAAVMLEMIQGEGGVIPANKKWLKELAQCCHDKGILLIIDEIQTGIGRTGTLYAYEQYGIEPDILTLAKGLGNGIPVGAMLGKQELADTFSPGTHGSTFGGNKLAMSVANQVLEIVNTQNFLSAVQEKSQQLFSGLSLLAEEEDSGIQDIRGLGLMVGLQMESEEKLLQLMTKLKEQGLLTLRAGKNVLRLLPPLTIKKEEIDSALAILTNVLIGGPINE
ncbi:acetylornithine transaminase [Enterococcus rivorum]|uniref:Acetylornithine aminotransferase n=1 Tax=Enterococcus rivorum TaxID=762845 RepID=A0A1E5KVV0_9ENTE|nr:acetylornithine transaminase [Enterococcus rivorum]MBP2099014.1 acetylornithine aminotransferase [Enterococcus rivorum]OEH81970.1 acetylornithine transaminase [Enterococcus rivorum]